MIIAIMGGYGNQMFQYAFAKELQYRGKRVKVDLSYFDDQDGPNTKRLSGYGLFGLDLPIVTAKEKRRLEQKNKLINTIKYYLKCLNISLIYLEGENITADEIYKKRYGYFKGYWQNEKLFTDVAHIVRERYLSELEKHLDNNSIKLLQLIQTSHNAVAVHVRGGDYLNILNKKRFGEICNANYYAKAFSKIIELMDNIDNIFVFTNDIVHANAVLPNEYSYHLICNSEEEGYVDLYLMSQCNNYIIANSTFSWWGSWLNRDKDKIVIAPKKWKETQDKNSDIYCREWITV